MGKISLPRIRSDLQGTLAPFMLPSLFRALDDDEELPTTVSGKVIKRRVLKEYFGTTDWFPSNNVPPRVELCDVEHVSGGKAKPWDWCGMQPAPRDCVST